MRGIVLEIDKHKSIVMLRDGTVIRIRGNYRVGQEIEVDKEALHRKQKAGRMRLVSTLAAAGIVCGLSVQYWRMNLQAVSYVSVDGDVSVELACSRKNEVISISGSDEDSEAFVSELSKKDYKGKSVAEVLDLLNEKMDSDTIIISISGDDEEAVESIQSSASQSSMVTESSGTVVIHTTDLETRSEAEENGISTGRYLEAGYGSTDSRTAVEDGTQASASTAAPESSSSSVPIEESRDMPVEDLVRESPYQSAPSAEPDQSSAESQSAETEEQPSAEQNETENQNANQNQAPAESRSQDQNQAPDQEQDQKQNQDSGSQPEQNTGEQSGQ